MAGDAPDRDGRRVRPAARRDRPVGRLRVAASAACSSPRSCSCRTASYRRGRSAASRSLIALVLAGRCVIGLAPGRVRRQGRRAVVRRDAGRPARPGTASCCCSSATRGTVVIQDDDDQRHRRTTSWRPSTPGSWRRSRSWSYARTTLSSTLQRGVAAGARWAHAVPTVVFMALRVVGLVAWSLSDDVVHRRRHGPRLPVVARSCSCCFLVSGRTSRTARVFGRHVYAVGGNAEAARRAGINVDADPHRRVRDLRAAWRRRRHRPRLAPALGRHRPRAAARCCSYSIAAAVIGGTSLFGGRGNVQARGARRARHRVDRQRPRPARLSAGTQYIVTGLVLLGRGHASTRSRARVASPRAGPDARIDDEGDRMDGDLNGGPR